MVITNYQVQSVLRTYTRELQRSQLSANAKGEAGNVDSGAEKVTISSKGQRVHMMDRMTSQVLKKMYLKQDNAVAPEKNEPAVDNGPVTEGNQ